MVRFVFTKLYQCTKHNITIVLNSNYCLEINFILTGELSRDNKLKGIV